MAPFADKGYFSSEELSWAEYSSFVKTALTDDTIGSLNLGSISRPTREAASPAKILLQRVSTMGDAPAHES